MLRTALGLSSRVAGGLAVVAGGVVSVAGGVVAGVLSLPRIADALDRLAPLAEALPQVGELRGTLERLEQLATFLANELPEALHQLEAVHAQLVALEPKITAVAGNTGQLDESIQVLAAALGPLQGTTERLGRLVDRLPDRRRRNQALPG